MIWCDLKDSCVWGETSVTSVFFVWRRSLVCCVCMSSPLLSLLKCLQCVWDGGTHAVLLPRLFTSTRLHSTSASFSSSDSFALPLHLCSFSSRSYNFFIPPLWLLLSFLVITASFVVSSSSSSLSSILLFFFLHLVFLLTELNSSLKILYFSKSTNTTVWKYSTTRKSPAFKTSLCKSI